SASHLSGSDNCERKTMTSRSPSTTRTGSSSSVATTSDSGEWPRATLSATEGGAVPNGRRVPGRREVNRQQSCRTCGYNDPVHAHRFRRKSRGRDRPAFIIDTMRCPSCGVEWTERYEFVKAELDSPKAS